MLKCPTCGHSLARLADPCLHCVPQAGRAAAANAPTSLTLPAELRVPEAPAVVSPLPAAAAQPRPATPPRLQVATVAERALRSGPAAAQPATAADAEEGPRVPTTPEPGHTPALSATVKAVAAGLALLVLVVCVSVLRHRDPVPAMPGGVAAGAASAEIAASAVAPDTAGAPAATARDALPLRSTASSAAAPSMTTARLKPRTPTVAHDATASPVVSPPPPAAAASPRPLAEPAPQAVPDPVVADPREACSKRGFIAAALCINERCAQPRYAGHAECVKLRKAAEDAELALQRGG